MTDPKTPITSLAGQALGDESSTERERRLAGAVLNQAREDQEAEPSVSPETAPESLDVLLLRKADLERKLIARRATPGYAQNVRDIEAEIERLDTEIARQRAESPEGD